MLYFLTPELLGIPNKYLWTYTFYWIKLSLNVTLLFNQPTYETKNYFYYDLFFIQILYLGPYSYRGICDEFHC